MKRISGKGEMDVLAVVTVLLVTGLTALRLWFGATMELLPEEAYYWTYTQHPALSYFDHPPMVAWVIWAGTAVFGDTELGVRVGTIGLSLGASALLWLLTRLWFGERAGWVAVLVFNLLPIFMAIGILAFPDGPLVFFWLLTAYAVSRAVRIRQDESYLLAGKARFRHRETAWWLLAGVALGGALLSKYTAVLLGVSVLVFLVMAPRHRTWLRRLPPWLATAVALAAFSIVIVWNAQHDWASFLFQSTRTAGPANHSHVWAMDVTRFWLIQVAILTPVGFGLLSWALARGVRAGWVGREERWNFVAAFALPLFAVFVAASFKTQVHLNWTAPAFATLAMGGAALLVEVWEHISRRQHFWYRWGVTVAAAFSMSLFLLGMVNLRWGLPGFIKYRHAGGWHRLADEVEAVEADLLTETGLEPFVLGADKYNLSAELSFYAHEPEEMINLMALDQPGLGFTYWTDLRQWEGHPAVAVLPHHDESTLALLRAHFDKVDVAHPLTVPALGSQQRSVYVVNCYNYHPPQGRSQPR